jgi:hypothetical protein
LECQ